MHPEPPTSFSLPVDHLRPRHTTGARCQSPLNRPFEHVRSHSAAAP